MKILLSEAENWVRPGRTKIYDDARKGVLSTEKDLTRGNKKIVDTAELERVYGRIHNPEKNPAETEKNGDGLHLNDEKLIQSYENRIQDLQKQLDLASERETALISEKSKLLNLTDRLQRQTETLMLPPVSEQKEKKSIGNRLQRLIGAR